MPRRVECRGLNVADAVSRRVRRMNFVGPAQLTPMQETEAFREGDGVKAARIQRPTPFWGRLISKYLQKRDHDISTT